MGAIEDRLSKLAVTVVCMIVAALLALGGVALLGAALYQALLPLLSPPLAAVLTGVAAFCLALIVVLIGRSVARRPASPPIARMSSNLGMPGKAGLAASFGQEMGLNANELVRAHASKVVIAALVAGFAMGVSPRLRRSLWQLLQ